LDQQPDLLPSLAKISERKNDRFFSGPKRGRTHLSDKKFVLIKTQVNEK